MRDPQQQKKLLAVLLIVLAAFSGYRFFQMSDPDRAVSGRETGGAGLDSRLADVDIPRLDLEALRREAATYTPGRDPFRFGPPPASARPEPPKPQPPPPRSPPTRAEPVQAPVTAPAASPPKPKPPPVDFVYLGSFGPADRRIAVFIKDDEIHNALAGDVLLDRFIVDKIGFESADIKFVGFPEAPEQRLEAGG